MISKWDITYFQMGYIEVITHLVTNDPNFNGKTQVSPPGASSVAQHVDVCTRRALRWKKPTKSEACLKGALRSGPFTGTQKNDDHFSHVLSRGVIGLVRC